MFHAGMNDSTLAAALRRLSSCKEPADLIYRKDAAQILRTVPAEAPTVSPAPELSPADEYGVHLARRIGTMVSRLNELREPTSQVILTPRMALGELMDIMRHALYASLPSEMQKNALPTDKAAVMKQFSSYVSSRKVPIDYVVEGLYVVSYVSVKLRVELVALQLQRRIQEELAKQSADTSEVSVAALVVTQTLLDDFVGIYNNIMLTVPIIKAAVRDSNANEAVQRLAPVYPQYYYQLCDWILVMESTMSLPPVLHTQVKKMTIDEEKGIVTVDLYRPTLETPWGLLLNEQGALVDIDVSLRIFEKAKELHDLLQSAPQGASIVQIKDEVIDPAVEGDYAAYTRHLLQTLRSASVWRKKLRLILQSSAFKAEARSLPREVIFLAPPQGDEGTSGQRVTLVLRRQSAAVDWCFTVDERLYWHAPSTRILSESAEQFVRAYGKHLRLLAVNGVEALHMTQVQLLIETANTVVLELLVMPMHVHEHLVASRSDTTPRSATATASNRTVPSAAGAEPLSATRRSDLDNSRMEAAMAKLVEQRASASTAGAPLSAADPPIAMETPLVEAAAIAPGPAAAAAVISADGAEAKKREGKPKALMEPLSDITVSAAGAAPVPQPAAAPSAESGGSAAVVQVAGGGSGLPGADPARSEGDVIEPCTFDNDVKLIHFAEDEMVLERPSLNMPWGLPIGRLSDPSEAPQQLPLRLMSLPTGRKARTYRHPFFRKFKKQPSTWYIAEVNGTPASDAEATLKRISQLSRMTLRFLRK
ncbi:hypothetical protein LSCM1_01394 [Leishmania martiniquensis]|uniref:Uncharacterized protein n=1 Tax=Leishmania martiniquensis TaxID=1580590 RepID=A0A836GT07_9TRYP|nr:hypothetical protein LSCM1_01394 [Leishmania martiniquensis]